ncbi:UNVERIFIED_CONTAM: hypothetical protein GTU68_036494 [Idotea baltica]|nr:hypothetical protein [Idotea baltica]
MLTGTEVKSIRAGRANFSDAYCIFKKGEIWILNLHISHYTAGSYNNHEPKRERKLLLNKREIKKIENKLKEKGLTLVPCNLFFNERGFAKVTISLAKGKKFFDKRNSIKDKDLKRESDRIINSY